MSAPLSLSLDKKPRECGEYRHRGRTVPGFLGIDHYARRSRAVVPCAVLTITQYTAHAQTNASRPPAPRRPARGCHGGCAARCAHARASDARLGAWRPLHDKSQHSTCLIYCTLCVSTPVRPSTESTRTAHTASRKAVCVCLVCSVYLVSPPRRSCKAVTSSCVARVPPYQLSARAA